MLEGLTVNGGLRVNGNLDLNGSTSAFGVQDLIDARAFGVSGTVGVDQTTALQSAINAAVARSSVDARYAPVVLLPAGVIAVSQTITLGRCQLVGGGFPTFIVWNGAAGGTVMARSATGSNSFVLIERVGFRSGTTEPLVFLDLTPATGIVDVFCRLRDVLFDDCTGDAVKVPTHVNCHWEHLRFDNIGGYAIRLTPAAATNLSSFVLDGFTYDHSRAADAGDGVFLVDNSANNSNLGTFQVSNGRIEVNTVWATLAAPGSGGSTRAVVAVRTSGATAPRCLGLSLQNITYSDSSGMTDDSLVFADDASDVQVSLHWWNVRVSNLSAVLGGNFNPSSLLTGPVPADLGVFGSIANTANGSTLGGVGTGGRGARVYSGTASPESVVVAPIGSLYLRTDGGAATTLYVKESTALATGWIAK